MRICKACKREFKNKKYRGLNVVHCEECLKNNRERNILYEKNNKRNRISQAQAQENKRKSGKQAKLTFPYFSTTGKLKFLGAKRVSEDLRIPEYLVQGYIDNHYKPSVDMIEKLNLYFVTFYN